MRYKDIMIEDTPKATRQYVSKHPWSKEETDRKQKAGLEVAEIVNYR